MSRISLRQRKHPRLGLVAAVAAILALTASVSTVAANPPTTYTGCLETKHGQLYGVAIGATPVGGTCKNGDQVVSWNETGPTGPTGAQGAPGTPYTAEWDFTTGTCTTTSGWDCDSETQTTFPAGATITVKDVEIDAYTNLDPNCNNAVFYAYTDVVGHNGYDLGDINFLVPTPTPIHPISLAGPHQLNHESTLVAVSAYCTNFPDNSGSYVPPIVSGKIIVEVDNPTFVIN